MPTLGIVLALGLLIRLLHFWAIAGSAYPRFPVHYLQSDIHAYWQWAVRILGGDLLGRDTYHPYMDWMRPIAPLETWHEWWGGKAIFRHPPFYPYWVAALLAVAGSTEAFGFVLLVQLVVGSLQPLVVFWLARRVFDVRVGLVAAGLTAAYGPLIFYQGAMLRDWLPPLVEPLVLLTLLRARDRERPRDWLLAGTAFGLALLVKETILVFVPLALAWLVLEHRGAWRRVATALGAAGLGFLLVLSPLIARNLRLGAPAFAVSNRVVAEAFIGANAADGSPIGLTHSASTREIMERSGGRTLAVVRETLRTYEGNWPRFLAVQFTKMRGLLDPLEVANNLSFSYGLDISPVLRLSLRYGLLLPVGVAGFLSLGDGWRRHGLLMLYGASAVAGLMVLGVVDRYRLILIPVLGVYGAAGLVQVFDRLRAGQTRWVMGYAALMAGVAAIQHLLAPPGLAHPVRQHEYHLAARIFEAEGRLERAVAEFDRYRRHVPYETALRPADDAVASRAECMIRIRRALQLAEEGQLGEARRQAEKAAAALALAPPELELHLDLGRLWLRLKDPVRARLHFERGLELAPQDPRAAALRAVIERLRGSGPAG